ncbi:MAG: hypothetical protein ABFS16_15470, partial [Bacteroidota bacterium]
MKRVLIILLGIIPFMLTAQNECKYFEEKVSVTIEKTDLNTTQSDFGPAFVNDELWHSAFTDEEIDKLARGSEKGVFYNLFTSKVDGKGNVTGGKSVKLEEQSEGYHAGPVSYC